MTRVNWARPLTLAATLLALGTLAYWLEYNHKPKQEEKEEQSKKLFTFKDTQVASIKIVDGSKNLLFKCADLANNLCKPADNSKWEIAEPKKLKADDANVNSLLSTINNLQSGETIDLSVESPEKKASLLKEYKLDSDSRNTAATKRIEVTSAKGDAYTVYLGDLHPIGDHYFGATGQGSTANPGFNDNKVYLIPTYFKANFDKDLTFWRDKKLFAWTAHDIASFELSNAKTQIKAAKKEGQWVVRSKLDQFKEEVPGDLDNSESFLSTVSYLSAKSFAADEKSDSTAKAALKGATLAARLVLQKTKNPADKTEPTPVEVSFYKKGDKPVKNLYAIVSNLDPLFELDAGTLDRINKDLKDFRLVKLLSSMDRFSTKTLTISSKAMGATPLELELKDSKWTKKSDHSEVNTQKVQNLLDRLTGNRIRDFIPAAKLPKGMDEGVTIVLGDDKNPQKLKYLFWKDGDKLYAKDLHSKRSEGLEVDNAIKDELPWSADAFKK